MLQNAEIEGIKKTKRDLMMSLKNLYNKFTTSEIRISYSTYCKYRLFWVLFPKMHEQESISVHTNTSDIADLTVNPFYAWGPDNISELSNEVLPLALANTNIVDNYFPYSGHMTQEYNSLHNTEIDAGINDSHFWSRK